MMSFPLAETTMMISKMPDLRRFSICHCKIGFPQISTIGFGSESPVMAFKRVPAPPA
jgi:hypothetical protein